MLDALIEGERDPEVLANMAEGRMKAKIPELVEALTGRFTRHHGFMIRSHLEQIDMFTARIDAYTTQIEEAIEPFRTAREALTTIPGVSILVADVIIAETGAEMSVFPSAAHLASWAGVCPSVNQSGRRTGSGHILPGNKHLISDLGVAAFAASHSKDTHLAARYRRLVSRRGPAKAIIAIEHTILTAAWNMLTTVEAFTDLGADYYTRRNPDIAKTQALRKLDSLDTTSSSHQSKQRNSRHFRISPEASKGANRSRSALSI